MSCGDYVQKHGLPNLRESSKRKGISLYGSQSPGTFDDCSWRLGKNEKVIPRCTTRCLAPAVSWLWRFWPCAGLSLRKALWTARRSLPQAKLSTSLLFKLPLPPLLGRLMILADNGNTKSLFATTLTAMEPKPPSAKKPRMESTLAVSPSLPIPLLSGLRSRYTSLRALSLSLCPPLMTVDLPSLLCATRELGTFLYALNMVLFNAEARFQSIAPFLIAAHER